MNKRSIGRSILDALSGVPLFATAPLYRHWHLRWGASDEEIRDVMPGDEVVPSASFNATRASRLTLPPAWCGRGSCRWVIGEEGSAL